MKEYLSEKQFVEATSAFEFCGWDATTGTGIFHLHDGVIDIAIRGGYLFGVIRDIIEHLGYGEKYCFPLKNAKEATVEFGESEISEALYAKLAAKYGRVVFLDNHPQADQMTILLDGVDSGIGYEQTATSHAWARLVLDPALAKKAAA